MKTILRLTPAVALLGTLLSCQTGAAPAASGAAVSPLELMQRAARHASAHAGANKPVLSPSAELMRDPATAESVSQSQASGFSVVFWTVDDAATMQKLFDAGYSGIISDRPDLLHSLVENNKQKRGGLLDAQGLLRIDRFDAQGHRGSRDLRPESTFPAFEAALDNLATTLETDIGVTRDGVPVLSHEPTVNPETCRETSGAAYSITNKVLIKDLAAGEIRRRFVCDKLIRGPEQKNDLGLSPVSTAFAREHDLPSAFVHPRLPELFAFVDFYVRYYRSGAGRTAAGAEQRAANASRVRFNLETKIDPQFPDRTVGPDVFVEKLASAIVAAQLESRADIQSFDYRTLVIAQEKFPAIRTVYLLGDLRQLSTNALPPELRQPNP